MPIYSDNLIGYISEVCVKYARLPALASKSGKEFQFVTYDEVFADIQCFARGLLSLGLRQGERVGLFADNRREWLVSCLGITFAGGSDVPRGSDITLQEITYIVPHSGMRFLIVENRQLLSTVQLLRGRFHELEKIILLDPGESEAGPLSEDVLLWSDVMQAGRDAFRIPEGSERTLAEMLYNVGENTLPDDIVTIIYTSGTTGTPKGVMLTHANFISQVENNPIKVKKTDRALSILPVWHIFERTFELLCISGGACTYYTNVRSLRDDLQKVRPTIMASAPRLWESLYLGILSHLEKLPEARYRIFRMARKIAELRMDARLLAFRQTIAMRHRFFLVAAAQRAYGYLLWLLLAPAGWLADVLVLRKLRALMGGAFRGTVSGGGALPLVIDRFFHAIGIPVLEGYGLTEASPVVAVRNFDNLTIGSVGRPYPGTRIRIVDPVSGIVIYPGRNAVGRKGEVWVRGPQVMKGYYRNQEATDAVIRDGWLRTGDIGVILANGCLKIVGRIKETIVLSSGENVEPAPIEMMLMQSKYIEHAVVIGQDQKHIAALIVPSRTALLELYPDLSDKDEDEVYDLIHKEIKSLINIGNGFKSYERVVEFRLLPESFKVGDELTAKLSVKRERVLEKYDAWVRDIYGHLHERNNLDRPGHPARDLHAS